MEFRYFVYLKKIKDREKPQEFGRIAQDIATIDLWLCGHKILEYNPVGRSDIETEKDGKRYVFEVKSGSPEINLKEIKERIGARIGEKRLVFLDSTFPARFYVLPLMELDLILVPCLRKWEDEALSKKMNEKLPEAIEKYYEFYKGSHPVVARERVKDLIRKSCSH